MDEQRILVIPGSVRRGGLNAALAQFASGKARSLGLQVAQMDLRALELPVYDGDLEASSGVPPGAHQLRDAIADSDGLLVVTPEYNGFPPPLVINAFDWLSRVPAGDSRPDGLKATAGKPVALLSASPGLYGGLRSINFLRQYLQMAFQMVVVPQQFTLGRAHEAFGPDGELKDPKASQSVVGVVSALAALAGALRGAEARGR
ncbi:MAG: NAD(P)H-dependent oxidoreductase [Rhodoferax sp.]|nr:NAD(P)H-dependent oxidoreductase [Rhodoferax sp.]MCP5264332.1 NAD(P)H-dependent oxidoreductase [Rhodoferax sp.]